MDIVEYDEVTDKIKGQSLKVKKRYLKVCAILRESDKCEVNRFKDHPLLWDLKGYRELHLDGNLLLLYKEIEGKAHLTNILTHKQLDKFEGELEQDEFEFCNNIIKL